MKLAIMQGRLVPPETGRFQSFPRTRWRDEFSLAAAAGLDSIEWIFDAYGEDMNPIGTTDGVREVRGLSERHGVSVESVCADWFMDFPLTDLDHGTSGARWQRLAWLMHKSASLQINRIVVPFVDASAIRTPAQVQAVVDGIRSLGDLIDRTNVELHLETSLSPGEFADLLAHTPHPGVKVNYDSGNSASLGYRPSDEFRAYGARVGSVHLKDRRLGAGTVPLGEGDTDFDGLFASLAKVRYRGDFVLQVARGTAGDELEWARKNSITARSWIQSLTGDRS
jgi:hexulose-6-phosphate isomerase